MRVIPGVRRRGTSFAVISILFVAFAVTIFGQQDRVISGQVVDINGHAVAGAVIHLSRKPNAEELRTSTDQAGKFSFAASASSSYAILVKAESFADTYKVFNPNELGPLQLIVSPMPLAADVSVTSSYLAGSRESLDEVPGSIERIDRETLANARFFNFSEALRRVSGVNIRDEEGFGLRPNIGIRGLNPTRSSKVLLLEDGLPVSYAPYGDNASYYHPPIERFESIEVLKGSGQIAYGPQTVGGVINYLTPNPTEKPTFTLRLTGGNRSFFNGSFLGSGTVGKTGIVASFARKRGDGSRPFINSKLNDLSTKVVQMINQRNSLTFKFSYYGENSNVTYSGLTEAEFAADRRGNIFKNDFFYGDRFGTSVSHASVLSSRATLITSGYANFFKRHWWRQSSNSGQRPNRLNVDPDCLNLNDLNTTCGNEGRLREYGTYGISPRFTLNYDAGSAFRGELQTGVRVHWESQDRIQKNGELPTSRDGVVSENNKRKTFAYSGFVQNRFVLGDLAVTPGIRFEKIDIERSNLLMIPSGVGKTSVGAFIPGIGIAYSGLPRTTVFAGVHRGFSPPRNEDIISNTGGVIELDPELSWNYEFGVRTLPFRGIRLESTFFRMDYENQIVPASLAGGVGATLTNGGRTLQQGMEFVAQIDSGAVLGSAHNFYVLTALTWLPIAEFRGVRFSSVAAAMSVTGNRLPYSPEKLLTTNFGYSHPKGFNAFVENVYMDRQFSDDLNTINPTANGQRGAIAAQTYWNATVNYRIEKWRSTLFVTGKNLFDRTFIVDRSRGILPSSPRLIQAGVTVRF
ncbi:MAG: TonB-dependent receptor plug domain-containing protein [Pyrinomonadaceae bacterium]|nr:TonB-dependent receptor plug domain-containing protein [Acidobacteriota bacterium]